MCVSMDAAAVRSCTIGQIVNPIFILTQLFEKSNCFPSKIILTIGYSRRGRG